MAEATAQQYEFKAEIQQLLHILVHSLYTDREIFLRELISNGSDALNRFQYELLTLQPEQIVEPDAELAIRVTLDEEAHTLTVSDSGTGMTREEMVDNLGTIARSGAAAFLKALQESKGSEIIGQFGVGFYSVFMVADRVEVVSRSYRPEAEAVRWSSTGSDHYEIGPAEKETRGTDVIVHLKEDAHDFANRWRAERIIKKHSDFVAFPIYLEGEQVNRQTALWRRRPRDVEAGEYEEFYKQLTLDPEPPLSTVHVSAEVPYDLHALLFIPGTRERGFLRLRQEEGLKLYSRKVLIQEYTKELLPNYLRFVDGVVDSEDLPLNISRETVQSNPVMSQLRRTLTGKVQKELERLATEEPEKYDRFWKSFGFYLKEGVATEYGAREELGKLLQFHSTRVDGEGYTRLAGYRERMAEGQEAIYYVLGEELRSVRRSPHLDPFRARDIEVLLLVDPVDGYVLSNLGQFDGVPLKNVDDPDLSLPPLDEEEQARSEDTVPDEAFARLLARAKSLLEGRVEDVVESKRLTDSPVRLAATEGGSQEMERLRRLFGEQGDEEPAKRRLELNRSHPLVANLARLAGQPERSEEQQLLALGLEQLFESALLQEGLHPNPADLVPRIQELLAWATRARATGTPEESPEEAASGDEESPA